MKRRYSVGVYIVSLITVFFAVSCSQRYHCLKCTSGSNVIHDTLKVAKEVITERVKLDTVVETKADTVVIREKNLVIRYKKLAGDTVFLSGSCEPDTLKVEVKVPVATEVKTGVPLFGVIGLVVLALVVGGFLVKVFG